MENFLLKRFNSKVKELNLIRENQNGFKKGHCTTHPLLRLIERIIHDFNNNKATLALFLDVESAFDKVWITGLISKLPEFQLTSYNHHTIISITNTFEQFTEILIPADGPSWQGLPRVA